jgi:hypothetical protein
VRLFEQPRSGKEKWLGSQRPTLKFWIEGISPKTFTSHTTTTITTTAFRIDLIDRAIGMNEFTSQRSTPTTINDMAI